MKNETQQGLLVTAFSSGRQEGVGVGGMFCYISHSEVHFIFFRVDFFCSRTLKEPVGFLFMQIAEYH
jgi:hypothetical protein